MTNFITNPLILVICMRFVEWMCNVQYVVKQKQSCIHVVFVLDHLVQCCLPTKDSDCKSDRNWHKHLKGLRCTSYLTYLTNSCQGAPHNGVLTSNWDLFIHGLAERKARPQANQRSALCSWPHCSHLSHWLYTARITGCQEGTVPTAVPCQASRLHT